MASRPEFFRRHPAGVSSGTSFLLTILISLYILANLVFGSSWILAKIFIDNMDKFVYIITLGLWLFVDSWLCKLDIILEALISYLLNYILITYTLLLYRIHCLSIPDVSLAVRVMLYFRFQK